VRPLVWSAAFVRALKHVIRRDPGLAKRVEPTLQQLSEDSFHPSLHTHKLKGQLASAWACTVDYDNRILFEFSQNQSQERKRFCCSQWALTMRFIETWYRDYMSAVPEGKGGLCRPL